MQSLQYSKIGPRVAIWLSELLLRLPFGFSCSRCSSFHQKSCERWFCTPAVSTPNSYLMKSKFWMLTAVAEGGYAAFFATIAWWQQSHQFLNHDICRLTLAMSMSQVFSIAHAQHRVPRALETTCHTACQVMLLGRASPELCTQVLHLSFYILYIFILLFLELDLRKSVYLSQSTAVSDVLHMWIVNEGQINPMYECNAPVEAKNSGNPGLIIYLVQHFCW